MGTINLRELKYLFRERHSKRGYYDFVKTSVGIAATIVIVLVFLYGALERFELTTFDYRMRLRGQEDINDKIVLVDMGEDSIRKIGRWPWPREWHATMISALSRFGAEAVIFDVLFSERADKFGDSAMEEAMEKSGNVYIPYAFELDRYDESKKSWDVWNLILPLKGFSERARGKGHITIVPDSDGTIRRIPLVINYGGKAHTQLAFNAACDSEGVDYTSYRIIKTPFGRYMKVGRREGPNLTIPVDKRNQILVNWAAKWEDGFKHYSYVDVITSYQNITEGKKPLINLDEFKDKICIIGLTAAGLYDIKPIPLQPTYPAVGAHANIINSILNKDFIRKAPRWLDALIIIILGVILSMNVSRVKPINGAFIVALMVIAYIVMSFLLLDIMNIWVSAIYPLTAIILSYLAITFYNQIVISIERAKLYALATKDGLTGLFVIRHFNLLLEAEIERVKERGGDLSILMADVDHFKNINDQYGHQVGDFILREVAGVIIACCRQLDIPSRYGGEEFIVMLPGAHLGDAAAVAERIRDKMEKHAFKMGEGIYKVTISIGVSKFEKDDTKDSLVKKADSALYEAKRGGRNKVCISRACNSAG